MTVRRVLSPGWFVSCLLVMALPWVPTLVRAQETESIAVFLDHSSLDWREARSIAEKYGGSVRLVVLPSALVGEFPPSAVEALQMASGRHSANRDGREILVVSDEEEAQALLSPEPYGPGREGLSFESQAVLRYLATNPPTLRRVHKGNRDFVPPSGPKSEPIEEQPPLLPLDAQPEWKDRIDGIGNTFYNTSDFLAGDVAIGIVRPESNGSGDGLNTEDWTWEEVVYSLHEILAALDWLKIDAPSGRLTFVTTTEHYGSGVPGTVDCDYEAVEHHNFNETVILDVLGKLGYTESSSWNRAHEWVNDLRDGLSTDWAIGIFVIDDSSTGDGRASAYLNGPVVWDFVSNDFGVYHHELGHIWGAMDEYPSAARPPISLWGYTKEVNANSAYNDGNGYFGGRGETKLCALDNSRFTTLCPWSRGQMGVWDQDGDGVYDPQDTSPVVTLDTPAGGDALTLTGTASTSPLPRESGSSATTDISINRITSVEWRVNGGPWQDAIPSDGAFDSSTESFSFTTEDLKNGGYVLEARSTDNFGNITTSFARQDAVVSSSPHVNTPPMAALSVSPALGSVETTFFFDAGLSRDPEDADTGLLYRWDFDNDGTWDTAYSDSPTTSLSFPTAGDRTVRVEVRDRQGLAATRTSEVSVSSFNTIPVARFTTDAGMVFEPTNSPVIFNFDAGASSDGEDDPADLLVRWDFEDDGLWDTAFSSTKTTSHDYASGFIADPIQESSHVYTPVTPMFNGLAQSFVARTYTIGRVSLDLRQIVGGTPAGTVTIGIKSSSSGPWLSSTTVEQRDIIQDRWSTYDLPNIAVSIGDPYYLVLLSSDMDMSWNAANNNPYSDGVALTSASGGVAWSSWALLDFRFKIYDAFESATAPLTHSESWRVRLEVKDSNGQTAQTVRDIVANGYDSPPTVSLSSDITAGAPNESFNLTASGSDPNSGETWDQFVEYRWDVDGDGNYESNFSPTNTRTASFVRSGIYEATCQVRDRYHATATANVNLSVRPIAVSMTVYDRTSGSSTETDERQVMVQLETQGMPGEMILSEMPSFGDGCWQIHTPATVFTLSSDPGLKTIYAKTRSGTGNESQVLSATISYQPVAPGSVVLTLQKSWPDVLLSWTEVGAFEYSVYRSEMADYSAYQELGASPVPGTTASDAGVMTDATHWFYSVEVDPLPSESSNLVSNGDMESWISPTDLVTWLETTSGGTVSEETNLADVYRGSRAARLTATGSEGVVNIISPGVPLVPGAGYSLSFAAKSSLVLAAAAQVRVRNVTQGEDLQANGTWGPSTTFFNFDLATEYEQQGLQFVVDPDHGTGDDFRLFMRHLPGAPIGSEMWIDDVAIRAQ